MATARLLWIDLCWQSSVRGLVRFVPAECEVARVDRVDSVVATVRQFRPQLACIEFDYPDQSRLQAVPALTQSFPALPLLMFTEHHSEALAVWAFRSGVHDYRVKPISQLTLARSIEVLLAGIATRAGHRPVGPCMPEDLIETAGHLQRPPATSRRTGMAVAHIARHFDQDLRRDALAALCHLSPSEFSRAFRREQGTTFEHFLLEYRIAMARDLLARPQMTISRAAYSTGFGDTSYFSRVFRRLVGVTASEYQRQVRLPDSSPDVPVRRPDCADSSSIRAESF